MKKGLFGKGSPQYGLPGMALPTPDAPMPNEISYTPIANPQPAEPQGFWQGGDKFTFRDGLAGALAVIGDAVSNEYGGGTGAVGNLMQARMRPIQEAAALAAEQRKRAADLADYRAQLQIKREVEGEKGPEIGTFEDNAGNVWRFDKNSGQVIGDAPMFVDRATRTMIQDGALIRVPNPYLDQGGQSAQSTQYAEGTVIENDNGQRMILRQGQWQPMGGTAGNGGGNFPR